MHHSGPLPQNFEGPEQGFEGKNCQNESGKTLLEAPQCCAPSESLYVFMEK